MHGKAGKCMHIREGSACIPGRKGHGCKAGKGMHARQERAWMQGRKVHAYQAGKCMHARQERACMQGKKVHACKAGKCTYAGCLTVLIHALCQVSEKGRACTAALVCFGVVMYCLHRFRALQADHAFTCRACRGIHSCSGRGSKDGDAHASCLLHHYSLLDHLLPGKLYKQSKHALAFPSIFAACLSHVH